jgi:hypothetical protein
MGCAQWRRAVLGAGRRVGPGNFCVRNASKEVGQFDCLCVKRLPTPFLCPAWAAL